MNIKLLTLFNILIVFSLSCNNEQTNEQASTDEQMRPGKLYKSEKVGFFTEQMEFTEAEAQKFWPIYNTYSQKRDSLWHSQRRFLINYNRNKSEIENSTTALQKFLSYEAKRNEIRDEYIEKLQAFMSDEQILTLFYTEHQFKHFILNRIRGRHGMERGHGRGMGRGQGRNNSPTPCVENL